MMKLNTQKGEGRRTLNVNFAGRRDADRIIDVAEDDAGDRLERRVHGQNALQADVDDVLGDGRVVDDPGEVDQLWIGPGLADEPRLALIRFAHRQRTLGFVCTGRRPQTLI